MDAIIIGSGFGGLGAALTLAQAGLDVLVLETLNYPGGCAGTFVKNGARFDAGATVAAGLGPGQLFRQWIDTLDLDVQGLPLDPAVQLRTPTQRITVPSDRQAFAQQLAGLPGAPDGIEGFFETQGQVANALWPLFSDPDLLPPLTMQSMSKHAGRAATYLPVLGTLGRTVQGVMARHGVANFAPLRLAVDAALQITVQTHATEADAAFGLSAMDFWFRQPMHISGGMGRLAEGLVDGIRGLGGRVSFADRAKQMTWRDGAWHVAHRRGTSSAPVVIANLLPEAVAGLLGNSPGPLESMQRDVERGWGAAALFCVIADQGLPKDAFHLQLIGDPAKPLIEGNHLLVSVSSAEEVSRAGPGKRVATVSTHLRMPADAERIDMVQGRMREHLATLAPELKIESSLPASPRTYARFTGRPDGWVGGPPRTRSLRNFMGVFPRPIQPGLFLVGDSAFPGQSTLATAVGGHRVATLAMRQGAFTRPLKTG